MWDTHPHAMGPALAQHDELISKFVDAHNGRVFKHTGDGMCAVFGSAGDAINAAAEIQRHLTSHSFADIGRLKVRVGIHTGEVESREDDYFGPPLNRVARLMSAAHGGQVLVSLVTQRMSQLDGDLTLSDLGEHRLRDLAQPETIFQLQGRGLDDDFAPIRTMDVIPNNLPTFATSFVGRDQELAEVTKLVGVSRLLTLTGAGGAGKTRLALQAVTGLVDGFPDGAWLTELASKTDPDQVETAVASACSAQQEGEITIREAIVNRLAGRKSLLVLDNCEHLIDPVAELVEHLLGQVPGLTVITTSRELLGVGGEVAYALRSLSLPGRNDQPSPSELLRYDSVRLFGERGAVARPSFRVTSENATAVLEICRRLDGMPLALELAAARLRTFTPQQIAENLDKRFRLLTGGSRTALPRQQTLAAAIDWSFRLLDDSERSMFERLSVFQGGFTLESVSAVCADAELDELDVLTVLPALVDKSLVIADIDQTTPRFRLLETLRQFSRDRLDETDTGEVFRLRHAEHFEAMALEAGRNIRGPDEILWWTRIDTELDNLRQAMIWSLESDNPTLTMSIATGFWRFWWFKSMPREGIIWLSQALNADNGRATKLLRATALMAYGSLAEWTPDGDGVQKLEESTNLFRELDAEGVAPELLRDSYAAALINLSVMVGLIGDVDRTEQLNIEALAVARRIKDETAVAVALGNLAEAAARNSDAARSRSLMKDAQVASEKLGSLQRMIDFWFQSGMQEMHFGDMSEAASMFQKAADVAAQAKQDVDRDQMNVYLAIAESYAGVDGATERLLIALSTFFAHPITESWLHPRINLLATRAGVELRHGDPRAAAVSLGASLACQEHTGAELDPMLWGWRDRTTEAITGTLGRAEFNAHFERGRQMTDEQAQTLLLSPFE